MYGIVWYQNREEGKKQLQKIVDDYLNKKNINYNKIIQFPISVIFENGDIWKLLKVGDSSRGHRCNVSFIERCISVEDFNTFIRPVTTLSPYNAYNFYGEGELEGKFNTWNINS